MIHHSLAATHGALNYIQANAYSQSHNHEGRSPGVFAERDAVSVTISREAGIDAGAYAHAIGQLLGWPVWDHELLELIAQRLRSNVHDLESLDERHVSWIQESLEAFLSFHQVSQSCFVHQLRDVLEELMVQGRCIIVGRGAAHIHPSKQILKIRLVAPLEERVANFRQQTGITDVRHATREVEKIDRERVRFVSDHFHKDSADPAAYDIVLNTRHFSATDCARLVLDFLMQPSGQAAVA
jgi:cytidylate kinase